MKDSKKENKKSIEQTGNEIANSPEYEVSMPFLESLEIKWPLACCICLKSVKKSNMRNLIFKATKGGFSFNSPKEIFRIKVPYCKQCYNIVRDGLFRKSKEKPGVIATFDNWGILSTPNPIQMLFKFRNPIYANLFLETNTPYAMRVSD